MSFTGNMLSFNFLCCYCNQRGNVPYAGPNGDKLIAQARGAAVFDNLSAMAGLGGNLQHHNGIYCSRACYDKDKGAGSGEQSVVAALKLQQELLQQEMLNSQRSAQAAGVELERLNALREFEKDWALRDCPLCAEPIKRVAKRCKHCHAEVVDADAEIQQVESEEKLAASFGCKPWDLDATVGARLAAARTDLKALEALHKQIVESGATSFIAKSQAALASASVSARHEASQTASRFGLSLKAPPVSGSVDDLLAYIDKVESQQALRDTIQDMEPRASKLGMSKKEWPTSGALSAEDVAARDAEVAQIEGFQQRIAVAQSNCRSHLGWWGPEVPSGVPSEATAAEYEQKCDQQVAVQRELDSLADQYARAFVSAKRAPPEPPFRDATVAEFEKGLKLQQRVKIIVALGLIAGWVLWILRDVMV
jgi:hypothetical protein